MCINRSSRAIAYRQNTEDQQRYDVKWTEVDGQLHSFSFRFTDLNRYTLLSLVSSSQTLFAAHVLTANQLSELWDDVWWVCQHFAPLVIIFLSHTLNRKRLSMRSAVFTATIHFESRERGMIGAWPTSLNRHTVEERRLKQQSTDESDD